MRGRRIQSAVEIDPGTLAWFVADDPNAISPPWGAGLIPELEPALRRDWLFARDDILRDWIERRPGTRPAAWWHWDSPEPARRRLGGIGTAARDARPPPHEFDGLTRRRDISLGREPDYFGLHLGLPRRWATSFNLRVWGCDGEELDPAFPPIYESQAAYLKRHEILSPSEARRLVPADFEPEAIVL